VTRGKDLTARIEEWVSEGLITPEQGEALKQRESARALLQQGRVQMGEILVYLGSLVVFLALAFLVGLNWKVLGSAGKILSVFLPTVAMLGLGWRLRGSEDPRLRRGAQALWLGACLLSVVTFRTTFEELSLIPDENLRLLVSFVLATGISGGVFALMPGITQSVTFHLCGSGALLAFLLWIDYTFPPFDPWRTLAVVLVTGGLWLGLSEWLWSKEEKGLVTVSRIVVSLTVLGWMVALFTQQYDAVWHKAAMEAIAFLLSVALIALSVRRQSQVFLYSGAASLLFLIAYVNMEHFAQNVGMPLALFIAGVLLIGLGLGTGQLSKRMRALH
jgi:hypothetical protein